MIRRPACLVCLAVVTGCGEPTEARLSEPEPEPEPSSSPTAEMPEVFHPPGAAGPDQDIERCGLEYSWLSAGDVGALVRTEPVYRLDRPLLTSLSFLVDSEFGVRLAREPNDDVEIHRMRYRTQDRGAGIDATGLVVFPATPLERTLPVILLLHGTTGLNDSCSPSRDIRDPLSDDFGFAAVMGVLASYGYIVVAPDYIGLKSSGTPSPELHPYLIGEATAIASWDALRAAERLIAAETDSRLRAGRVAVWGASQGGHAAAFTVRYGPYYAPEYDVAAAVYAIPPSNLRPHLTRALRSLRPATGNTILFVAAASQWYQVPGGTRDVFEPPFDEAVVEALYEECSPELGDVSLEELFTDQVLRGVQDAGFDRLEPWNCIVRENSLTTTSVTRRDSVPALMVLAENDQLVDSAVERASFDALCDDGMPLYFLECAGAEHSEGFIYSVDDALDFIDAGLDDAISNTGRCERVAPTVCSNTPEP